MYSQMLYMTFEIISITKSYYIIRYNNVVNIINFNYS